MARKKKKDPGPYSAPSERKREVLENGHVHQGDGKQLNEFVPGYNFSSTWDSPEAFSRHIQSIDRSKSWYDAGYEKGEGEWAGSESMEATVKLAQEGWKEGAEQVERVRDYITALHPTAKRPKKHSIAGAYPNVPRAVAGDPMNMVVPDSAKSRKRPVITLVSNMACNWTVKPHVLSNRAAAIAALVDQIEAAGYACEVISGAASHGYGGFREKPEDQYKVNTAVVVKTCDQPVDTQRLAFGLGHASMFRRMIFADWSAEPTAEKLGYGLGYSQHGIQISDEHREEKHIFNIPSTEDTSSLWKTEEDAAKKGLPYLINALAHQKCPPFMGMKLPKMDEETDKLFHVKVLKDQDEDYVRDYDDDLDDDYDD